MSDDLVPTPEDNRIMVRGHSGRLYPAPDATLAKCPSNIDSSTLRGKALLLAAGNPGDYEFLGGIVRIVATHWLIYAEERADPETGEIAIFARTVLFDAEGRSFRTSSAHAPHRIQAALDLFEPADWERGIPFIIRERMSTKTKRIYHDIRLYDNVLREEDL